MSMFLLGSGVSQGLDGYEQCWEEAGWDVGVVELNHACFSGDAKVGQKGLGKLSPQSIADMGSARSWSLPWSSFSTSP